MKTQSIISLSYTKKKIHHILFWLPKAVPRYKEMAFFPVAEAYFYHVVKGLPTKVKNSSPTESYKHYYTQQCSCVLAATLAHKGAGGCYAQGLENLR